MMCGQDNIGHVYANKWFNAAEAADQSGCSRSPYI